MIKITIDREGCISCGACWTSCSDVYEQNSEDAKSQVAEKFQVSGNVAEGKIEDSLLKCALQGADICPVQVISVVK